MKRSKLKIKPKFSKSSDWEIVEDIPMFQDGGGYQWSTQKQEPVKLAVPNYATTKTDGRTKPLTEKELQDFRKHTENLKLQQQQQELAARKARIEQSIQAQSQPFSAQNLATETQAIGDKLRFFPNAPSDSNFGMIDNYINPFKFLGDMASGLGSVPYNVQQGNYGQAALAVGIPLGVGALAGIGTNSTKQFINNLTNPVPDFGKYLTTKTPLKNTFKINPFSSKLGQYNRVVGEDAIQDIINTGLVRSNPEAGVKTTIGALRQTPFPSFAKGSPRQTYINQTVDQGHVPYIISTDRPMAVSTLGRHGKGSTMFPVDDNYVPELKNYLSGFSANEAKVFEANPHWLKGYKPVNTSTPNFKSGGKIKTDPQGYWNPENINEPALNIPSNYISMENIHFPILGISDEGDTKIMQPNQKYKFKGKNVKEIPLKQNGGMTQMDSVKYMAGKTMDYEKLRGNQYGQGLSNYGNPILGVNPTKEQAVNWYMQNTLPKVQPYFNTAMELSEAGDFVYNSGRDPRIYMLDQYLKTKGSELPNRGSYNIDMNNNPQEWTKKKSELDSLWNKYKPEIDKLSENDRRILLNKGRDFYYQNINKKSDGSPSDAYWNTWYGRIWNTNDFKPFDPNNPKFIPLKQQGGQIKDNLIKIDGEWYNQDIIDGLDRDDRVERIRWNTNMNRYGAINEEEFYKKFPTEQHFILKNQKRYANHIGSSRKYVPEDEILMQQGGQVRQPIPGTQAQYQAYRDSLDLYNYSRRELDFLNTQPSYTDWANYVGNNPIPRTQTPIFAPTSIRGTYSDYPDRSVYPTSYQFPKPVQPIILRPKEQPINLQSSKPDLLQSNSNMELNPIPFTKGTYFTRERQNQEQDSKQFGRKGKADYFDKKTGKLLGTYKKGGEVNNSDWEII